VAGSHGAPILYDYNEAARAAAIVSAAIGAFHGPGFRRLALPKNLYAHKESRLHSLRAALAHGPGPRALELSCYDCEVYKVQQLQWSERFILTQRLGRLKALSELRLPFVAEDAMLASIALCCPNIQVLDVHGSHAVNDLGLRWLAAAEDIPKE